MIERAINFAADAHFRQTRKYNNEPYVNHSIRVMDLVKSVIKDENIICAAVLHDVLEDTQVSLARIKQSFNASVADIVLEVTNISHPSDGNRATRKAIDRIHLSKSSYGGASIKLADIIDNCGDLNKHDPKFAQIYLKEKRELLNFLKHGDHKLYSSAVALTKC